MPDEIAEQDDAHSQEQQCAKAADDGGKHIAAGEVLPEIHRQHNIGQLCGAAVLLSDHMALAYAPVLLCAGTVVGSLTWAVSRAVFPALRRVWKSEEKRKAKYFKI